jgi:hypothetical protein
VVAGVDVGHADRELGGKTELVFWEMQLQTGHAYLT